MKKKNILVVLLCIAMSLMMFSCGESSEESSKPENPNRIGDFEVSIESYKLTKDYDGKDAILITYNFTNNSDEAADFMTSTVTTVYQDGVELETAIVDSSNDNDMKSIKKGKSIEVQGAYVLSDTSTDVEVEVEEFVGSTDEKVTKTFKLK